MLNYIIYEFVNSYTPFHLILIDFQFPHGNNSQNLFNFMVYGTSKVESWTDKNLPQ